MKNYFLVLVSIFTLSFTTVTDAQNEIASKAIFNEFNGESYSFTVNAKGNESNKTIEFSEVSDEILKQFDLKSETLKGKHFLITYTISTETKVDADGNEEEVEVYTLTSIKEAVY